MSKRVREDCSDDNDSSHKRICIKNPIETCREYMNNIYQDGYLYNLLNELLHVIDDRDEKLNKVTNQTNETIKQLDELEKTNDILAGVNRTLRNEKNEYIKTNKSLNHKYKKIKQTEIEKHIRFEENIAESLIKLREHYKDIDINIVEQ